jgi:hypothetical protein
VPARAAAARQVEEDEDADVARAAERGHEPPAADAFDPTDPLARNPALTLPSVPAPQAPAARDPAADGLRARMSMEELVPALVRRIAWTGDKHRGTVRLELGAGAWAGTTLLVHADAGRLRVEVSGAGDGPALDALRRRLDARLRAQGLDVESVT